MATLWETVTGNSTLPVQAGNNFWDHLHAQAGGGGGPTQLVVVEAFVNTERQDIDVTIDPLGVAVEIAASEFEIVVENEITVDVEVDRTETLQ